MEWPYHNFDCLVMIGICIDGSSGLHLKEYIYERTFTIYQERFVKWFIFSLMKFKLHLMIGMCIHLNEA